MINILGIIPARYSSTRFPGKPLADIKGKSMIQRVYESASKCKSLAKVVVATDDDRIFNHVKSFGGEVVLTNSEHPSGTDRCFEALNLTDGEFDYVVNIQGDEPMIVPAQIDELCAVCDGKNELITQMIKVQSYLSLFDNAEVKIVLNKSDEAIYFSRSVIPFLKNPDITIWHELHDYFRHVGMYAYRADVLKKICKLKPSKLELAESLEQLRWIENGFKIKCVLTSYESHCVDTMEDLQNILSLIKE